MEIREVRKEKVKEWLAYMLKAERLTDHEREILSTKGNQMIEDDYLCGDICDMLVSQFGRDRCHEIFDGVKDRYNYYIFFW